VQCSNEITITIINMGQKFRGANTKSSGLRPTGTSIPSGFLMHAAVLQPFDHNRNGPKIGEGALTPFLGRVERGPYLTQSPGLRPTSIPSGILIHPAIWLQQVWAKNWGALPACQVSS